MSSKSDARQNYLIDSTLSDEELEAFKQEETLGIDAIIRCNRALSAVCFTLKKLSQSLKVNYPGRIPSCSQFLDRLASLNVGLDAPIELAKQLSDAIDQFCAGDINAFEGLIDV